MAALAAGAAATAVALERRRLRAVASDPERAFLEHPPSGRPLRARSVDGTELHVEVFGSEQQPTLVLAHGWTEALQYWAYVIRELGDEFRIVAYDLRGHGRSAPAAGGDYALERFGEDLEAVLSAAASPPQRAIVAGHSLGAMSIAAWAESHDLDRISGAALLFTGLGDLIPAQLLIPVAGFAHALSDPIARRMFFGSRIRLPRYSSPLSDAILRYIAFGPSASPAVVAFWERMLLQCEPDVRAAVGLSIASMSLHHALARLTVPTLVMAGAKDRLTPPSHSRRMASELPQLQAFVELPDCGHMGPLERPRDVAQALRALARECLVPGSGVADEPVRGR